MDSLLGLSKGAAVSGTPHPALEHLSNEAFNRFWEELARSMNRAVLERSQELLASLLEDLKRSSFQQEQGNVDELIRNSMDEFQPQLVNPSVTF